MKQKIIKVDDYIKYFTRNNPHFLVNWNIMNGQNYFFLQASLPIEFVHDEDGITIGNHIYRKIINNGKNEYLANLELFGCSYVDGDLTGFLFKPWIIGEQKLMQINEAIMINIPSSILFSILSNEITFKNFTWENIQHLEVIKDINIKHLNKYNLDKFDNSIIKQVDYLVEYENLSEQMGINISNFSIDEKTLEKINEYYDTDQN